MGTGRGTFTGLEPDQLNNSYAASHPLPSSTDFRKLAVKFPDCVTAAALAIGGMGAELCLAVHWRYIALSVADGTDGQQPCGSETR
jgi:hypothetical protein